MYDVNTEDFLISEKPFFSIFLQTKAGYEEGIIKNINNTLSEIKIKDIPLNLNFIKILKCFGHFDVAILFNLDNLEINIESFEKINHEISKIEHITDSNSIVGYSWDCFTDITGLDFCWGISSIKLDIRDRYLFSWNEIPGNDSVLFNEYLIKKFDTDWVKKAQIKKNNDGRTINLSDEKNSLSLELNNEKTKAILTINEERKDEFTVIMEESKLSIYHKSTLNPIKIEKEVIKKIIDISNKTNFKIKIFGGLGWNELIVIINSSSLKKISEFVYNIRVFDDILDISTIPAVEWGCWNHKNSEKIPNCQILITHRSRRDYPIRELMILLAKKFNISIEKKGQEDIGLIFGGFDIILPIINSELNNIIKYILELRKIKTITKTNTIFSPMQIPSDKSLSKINLPDYLLSDTLDNSESGKNIEILISKRESKLIDLLDNEIQHLHNEYQELKNDDYTKSLYLDLKDFFKDLDFNINYAKELEIKVKNSKDLSQKRELASLLEQLKKIIQSIEFSIYQRISGMQMSYLMESKHTGFEKFGGIQRIILATEAIPMQIFNNTLEQKWKGFCVFGSEPDFISQTVGEVISIPFEYKYKPEKWWGLGHEIGHLLMNRMKRQIFIDFNDNIKMNFDKDFENFRKDIEKMKVYDKEILDEYRNREFEFINQNIIEICSDYLNFKIVFFSDWNSFISCTLNYLHSRGYDILSETRLIRVISISEHIDKKGVEKDTVLLNTIKNIRNLNKYDEIYLKDRIHIIKNQTFFPYFKTVDKILNNLDILLKDNMKYELFNEIDQKLNRGEIIESNSNFNSDLSIIYILKSLINRDINKDITFKHQITSILSLYNYRFSE